MSKYTIICFCKQPNSGYVKSRLSKDIGCQLATSIYKVTLEYTIKSLCRDEFNIKLYCYPDTKHKFIKYLANRYKLTLHEQTGNNLGMRMFNALNECLQSSNAAVLIGSDCLQINHTYVRRAFYNLEHGHNAVIGPTLDGGYALIGLHQAYISLFENVDWSTNKVLQQTKNNMSKLNWRFSCLPVIRDIDTNEDYMHFKKNNSFKQLFKKLD